MLSFLKKQYINVISDTNVDLSWYVYGWKKGTTEILSAKSMKTLSKSFYVTCECQKQCSRKRKCFKNNILCSEFANSNLFPSRNLTPCKVPAFSHSFLVKKFSINEHFTQNLWKFAKNSAETVCLQNISSKGLHFTSCYLCSWKSFLNLASNYNQLCLAKLWFSDDLFVE